MDVAGVPCVGVEAIAGEDETKKSKVSQSGSFQPQVFPTLTTFLNALFWGWGLGQLGSGRRWRS